MIGFHEENSSRLQDLVAVIEKRFLEETLLVVTLFRPWIREEIKNRLNFIFIEHEAKALSTGAEVAEIFMFELIEFLGHGETALEPVIKADEIDPRIFLAVLEHEIPVAGADLDFEGIFISELLVPFPDVRFRGFVPKHEGIEDRELIVVRIFVSVLKILLLTEVFFH